MVKCGVQDQQQLYLQVTLCKVNNKKKENERNTLYFIGELGDYDPEEHRQGYLEDFRFVPFQNPDFEKEVEQYHKEHR